MPIVSDHGTSLGDIRRALQLCRAVKNSLLSLVKCLLASHEHRNMDAFDAVYILSESSVSEGETQTEPLVDSEHCGGGAMSFCVIS
ncbi:hypothetical protein OE88DRAFT_1661112 [Heliocybe sulcata]|uniref:Uncharacterized protein n=1 Tax=Heliocybe sulcata TaxID=5364 RepID=A0A5C3MZ45_9AGAM|nr:hypothetical protein OE88DRAFT_1661112 [Heliocybe sulcata]